MKKIVQFKGFENDNDYLYFDIDSLIKLEKLTGHTVIELWDFGNNGKFGITLIVQCLLVGLAESREGITESIVMREMSKAIESGKNLSAFITPIFQALLESGIFGGKKQVPEAKEG